MAISVEGHCRSVLSSQFATKSSQSSAIDFLCLSVRYGRCRLQDTAASRIVNHARKCSLRCAFPVSFKSAREHFHCSRCSQENAASQIVNHARKCSLRCAFPVSFKSAREHFHCSRCSQENAASQIVNHARKCSLRCAFPVSFKSAREHFHCSRCSQENAASQIVNHARKCSLRSVVGFREVPPPGFEPEEDMLTRFARCACLPGFRIRSRAFSLLTLFAGKCRLPDCEPRPEMLASLGGRVQRSAASRI
ncbi:hypothetical protein SAMN04488691_101112 [Haloferax larsenii]|uniref:Uncharacterized protein n=1 Tax=Haloferax larsenii TaxID=302484 RepID=A0A1H7FTK2_HALLR|nr:hypothetical protein SAMN04488691_101112 [Haloferax larsenii]